MKWAKPKSFYFNIKIVEGSHEMCKALLLTMYFSEEATFLVALYLSNQLKFIIRSLND